MASCLSIHPWVDTWGCFYLSAMVHSAAMTMCEKVFACVLIFSCFGVHILRSGIAGSNDNSAFNFLRNSQVVFPPFYDSTRNVWGFWVLQVLTEMGACHFIYLFIFKCGRCSLSEVTSHRGFPVAFPNGWWRWASFRVLTGHLYSCVEKWCLLKSFAQFLVTHGTS